MANRDNPDFLSASTIKGDKIVNRAGDDIGKIEELMIDLQNGRIAYAVLSFGGFMGMGDKLFAIPWNSLTLRVHEHAFFLDIPKETLEKAEGFDKDNWPLTRERLSSAYTYYGYQPYWQTGMAARTGILTGTPGETESERTARMRSTTGMDNPDFLPSGKIKGDKVVNRAGEDLGKIEELMIDLQDGKVAYAVVSHGGFLGIGNKLFSIPWKALTLSGHEHAFFLDIPKETLEKAEGFDKDNWPLTREELSSAYTYYGYQPYWLTGAAAQTGILTGMPGETESERIARMGSVEDVGSQDFLSASTIKNDKVVNTSGDDLGKVVELMIDLQDGRIAYAVLSFGGFLGMGDKLFAIPWQALLLRPHEHGFTLDIPKDVLEKAEGFDKDNWPLTRDRLASIYTYYGYQPYWQTRVLERTEKERLGETESERMARIEMERQGPTETETERLARLEKERMGEQRL
jgi:sporulation protein YlmC with PRC-barrel domain